MTLYFSLLLKFTCILEVMRGRRRTCGDGQKRETFQSPSSRTLQYNCTLILLAFASAICLDASKERAEATLLCCVPPMSRAWGKSLHMDSLLGGPNPQKQAEGNRVGGSPWYPGAHPSMGLGAPGRFLLPSMPPLPMQ